MPSVMFKLKMQDLGKGLVTAIFAAVFVALAGIVQQPGFDLFTVDYAALSHSMLNIATASFMAYLAKNFFSDSQGNFAGIGSNKQ